MNSIKEQFPLLAEPVKGKQIVYLDNAATTQKPAAVLKALDDFYRYSNANPHRGVYDLAVRATQELEDSRKVVADFIGADDEAELIFTRNATEALNLIAYSYGMNFLKEGDGITISVAEHHSNLVPWQHVAKATGSSLDYLYLTDGATVSDEEIAAKITEKTKLVSVVHISNVLGVLFPIEKIVKRAHEVGAVVVLDCAQSIPHMPVDVKQLGVDFAVFSGHKMYAPLGIGALWGKRSILEKMPPFLAGGDMIDSVEEQVTTYAPLPQKFEAGTQNAGGAVALAAAIRFMQEIGWEEILKIEHQLMEHALEGMRQLPYVSILGGNIPAEERYGVISFNVQDVHPHDVASILDADGVCIRAGHHCAQPLLHHLNLHAANRISFAVYNTIEDVDAFLNSLKKVRGVLGYGA